MDLLIRPADLPDIPIVQQIACLTWPDAYVDILSPGQMRYMQHMMYSRKTLEKQLLEENHRFLIAENGRPIGFAGAGPINYQLPNKPSAVCWKLHKLYVLPYIQKSGVGKMLLQEMIQVARNNGATTLLLNVNRHNTAYAYYLKLGFTVIDTGDFDIGAGFFMNDYIMAKPI